MLTLSFVMLISLDVQAQRMDQVVQACEEHFDRASARRACRRSGASVRAINACGELFWGLGDRSERLDCVEARPRAAKVEACDEAFIPDGETLQCIQMRRLRVLEIEDCDDEYIDSGSTLACLREAVSERRQDRRDRRDRRDRLEDEVADLIDELNRDHLRSNGGVYFGANLHFGLSENRRNKRVRMGIKAGKERKRRRPIRGR